MNQQMSSDFFFSKVLTSFPKMFLDGLQKNMLLLVVLIFTVTFVGDSAPASIATEITLEQLKEHYQELKIQLETKVNDLEREMEAMKRASAEERRKMERAFGMPQRQMTKLATLHRIVELLPGHRR